MIGLRKMPLPSHDSETHAAYFMLGLARVSVLHDMDGQIEHAQQLCRWASIMADLEQVGAGIVKDYPGCIQYEVSEPFGEWYGWKAVRGKCRPTAKPLRKSRREFCISSHQTPTRMSM
ncbi:hypothetical protein ACHMW6_00075 (plasmid) [Pseudoduganella sp. UC29_106]|uniref:hypothetical protein n=1 Tax=Pseudoduganella sp. UC29_106 TaxID=3374553 RepID=UPI003757DB5E